MLLAMQAADSMRRLPDISGCLSSTGSISGSTTDSLVCIWQQPILAASISTSPPNPGSISSNSCDNSRHISAAEWRVQP